MKTEWREGNLFYQSELRVLDFLADNGAQWCSQYERQSTENHQQPREDENERHRPINARTQSMLKGEIRVITE